MATLYRFVLVGMGLYAQFSSGGTSDAAGKFDRQSALVKKWASVKISKANHLEARTAASSLLKSASSFKDNWNYGNAIHHSHLVLGRVALHLGQVGDAKRELKLAAQTPGSPQLNSFGPNMTLAKELLEKGEKTAILEYFQDCAKFWNDDIAKAHIAEWKAAIENGKIPAFRGNLVY